MRSPLCSYLDWGWGIPRPLLTGFNLEDYYNSIDWHYGMRCSPFDQVQKPDLRQRDKELDKSLSGRMRKVLTLFEEAEKRLVVSVDGGTKE